MFFLHRQSRMGLQPTVLFFIFFLLPAVALAEDVVVEPQPLFLQKAKETVASIGNKVSEVTTSLKGNTARTRRDPFAATQELIRESIEPTIRKKIQGFTPKTEEKALPPMFLRGHLTGPHGDVVALLQIDKGEVHIVRQGDTISLQDFGIDSVIRIKEISRLHLLVESGTLGQMIIVR